MKQTTKIKYHYVLFVMRQRDGETNNNKNRSLTLLTIYNGFDAYINIYIFVVI
jgi:hypothetical protein